MVAAVGILSTSSILVWWAVPPLHPITVTAGRMALGSLTVIAISLTFSRTWRPPPAQFWPQYLLYGLIAAAHI
jgi:hypothetical protein